MWYVVYDTVTGAEVSQGPTIAAALPAGLSAVPYESRPVGLVWDAAERMLVVPTPPAPSRISRQTFLDRIGPEAEVGAQIGAWSNTTQGAQLRALLLRLQVVADVDVADPRTVAGVDALIAAGILDADQRAAVLALPT
jgi:hypothetical protein